MIKKAYNDIGNIKDQVIKIQNISEEKLFLVAAELHELKEQKRIEDILLISNQEGDTIGQIKYQATWIYNKREFLKNLLKTMNDEREDLIREIRN